jgi:hypothetical protein
MGEKDFMPSLGRQGYVLAERFGGTPRLPLFQNQ